jgi:hypothetical protein
MDGTAPPGRSDRGLPRRGTRQWAGIAILSLWLVGWAYGEWMVVQQLFFSGELPDGAWFLGLWLVAWTAGGLLAARALLRLLTGQSVPPTPPEPPRYQDGGVG